MRYAVYVAAAGVIGLLIGFVVLSIGWLRRNVLRSIRTKTLGLLDTYDDLLAEKSRELSRLEQELQEKQAGLSAQEETADPIPKSGVSSGYAAAPAMLRAAERAGTAAYRDDALGEVYRLIRENFSFRLGEVLTVIGRKPEDNSGPAGRLLEALSVDTVYQLSTLPEETQLEVLSEALDEDGCALLESYLSDHRSFRVLEFYDFLKAAAEEERQPVRVWVPAGSGSDASDAVEVLTDGGICEGFQVEIDHLLYDYSIRTRELS